MRIRSFIFVITAIGLSFAQAYEVDNFTGRYKPLKDSTNVLNAEVNKRLKEAAAKVNEKGILAGVKKSLSFDKSCSTDDLFRAVGDELLGGVVGELEEFAIDSSSVAKSNTDKDRVYRTSRNKGGMLSLAGVEPSINVGGHYIGVDKLGHFFDQGKDYYDVAAKTKGTMVQKIDAALAYGTKLENGRFGLMTTGIKSHGDLAANYGGYLFWSRLVEGVNPFFKCNNGNWIQVRDFDWGRFVNPAWDEAVNCSVYDKAEFQADVTSAQKKLEFESKNKRKFTCPVSIEQCRRMTGYFGTKAKSIISPTCHQQAKNTALKDNYDYYSVQPMSTSSSDKTSQQPARQGVSR